MPLNKTIHRWKTTIPKYITIEWFDNLYVIHTGSVRRVCDSVTSSWTKYEQETINDSSQTTKTVMCLYWLYTIRNQENVKHKGICQQSKCKNCKNSTFKNIAKPLHLFLGCCGCGIKASKRKPENKNAKNEFVVCSRVPHPKETRFYNRKKKKENHSHRKRPATQNNKTW